MTASSSNFHILALSGGGFRALYTAAVLESIEQSLGAPLATKFDLICGTSSGGLLALGLAKGLPASELREMFEIDGSRIFGRPRFGGGLLISAKHRADGLKEVLSERFGSTTIGELTQRVLVPSVNYSTGRGQFFKTPHAKEFEKDYVMTLVDVGLATTAAPVYLPLHRIDATASVYADGGLIGNSPGLFGVHEAVHFLDASIETVRVLSIGTMATGATIGGDANLDRSAAAWGEQLYDLIISAQDAAAHFVLKQLLRSGRYIRVDAQPTPQQSNDIALDRVSRAAINVLKARGADSAKTVLGDSDFQPFRQHVAPRPHFYHG